MEFITSSLSYLPMALEATGTTPMADKLADAGINTLLGMGTAFAVLILISLIISLFPMIGKIGKKQPAPAPAKPAAAKAVPATHQSTAIQNILSSIQAMETTLSDKIAKVIDEKLEGMDEVVVELIRCKTDNETLRQKIVDLNKEVYQLKNKLNSYKPVGLGFYVKKDQHIWE